MLSQWLAGRMGRMVLYAGAPMFAKPVPVHAQTDAAQAARDASVAAGVARTAARNAPPELITHHPPPWAQIDVTELTGAAKTFAAKALAAGRDVAARSAGAAVCVGVRSPSIRAYWVNGRTGGVLLDGYKVAVATAGAALTGDVQAGADA